MDGFFTRWKDAPIEALMDTKLKCVFELPVEGGSGSSGPDSAPQEDARRVGDSANNHDGELLKAAKEVKILREEESSLRQENIKLKEELLLVQRQLDTLRSASAPMRSTITQSPPVLQPQMIVIAILMALSGIILGKFLL
ncbi:hypothetical protein AAG570_004617 [Ranatra chinensis]|uniref:Uncharacterized protein n=1 Tax=Ranatra chinensis TaxID=642074 RepID=A0ABD0Y1G8_9HEMI